MNLGNRPGFLKSIRQRLGLQDNRPDPFRQVDRFDGDQPSRVFSLQILGAQPVPAS